MSIFDHDVLECSHITESREKYDASIDGKKKLLILCNTCVDTFKNFNVIKILSKILETI